MIIHYIVLICIIIYIYMCVCRVTISHQHYYIINYVIYVLHCIIISNHDDSLPDITSTSTDRIDITFTLNPQKIHQWNLNRWNPRDNKPVWLRHDPTSGKWQPNSNQPNSAGGMFFNQKKYHVDLDMEVWAGHHMAICHWLPWSRQVRRRMGHGHSKGFKIQGLLTGSHQTSSVHIYAEYGWTSYDTYI